MTENFASLLQRWVNWVCNHALSVIIFILSITVLSVFISVTQLRINTNTEDMISSDLSWRRHQIVFKKNFPQLIRNIVVVIDGYTPELADQARARLTIALEEKPAVFQNVFAPGGGEFFNTHGLLFLSEDALVEFSDQIADAQPFLQKLAEQPSLESLFTLLRQAINQEHHSALLGKVFKQLTAALNAENDNSFHRLSWQELMQSRKLKMSDRRQLLIIEPRLTGDKNTSRRYALRELRNIFSTLGLNKDPGISVRVTGTVAMEHEELQSVSRGALVTGVLTLVLVTAVLLLALSSPKLIAASLATLIAGLSITAAFAAIAIGNLNIISVAFAVLYIGLGIDFAIHYCMHVRSHSDAAGSVSNALILSAREVGPSLLICTITTAIGFYAFIPTDFSGVSQLGIISGTGMFISFILSMSLLPALIFKLKPAFTPEKQNRSWVSTIGKFAIDQKRVIRFTSLGVVLIALLLASQVRFDNNPINLRDQNTESVKTFLDLIDNSGNPPLTLSVLSPNETAARTTAQKLQQNRVVDDTVWIGSLIPKQQVTKLALIDETNLILGGALPEPVVPVSNPVPDLASIDNFIQALPAYLDNITGDDSAAAQNLLSAMQTWRMQTSGDESDMESLTENIMTTLPLLIKRLNKLLSADTVSMDTLPVSLTRRWISESGQYRIEVLPNENVNQHDAAARFVSTVESIAPNATGLPVIHIKAGATVVEAFRTAFVTAFVLIGLLLFALFRHLKDSTAVLFQLLLAAILTGACAVIFSMPFNFANIIALPLLLGVGVDSGIHMVHRARALPPADGNLLATSTGRAIFFSTMTTMCGFGGLALSSHPGTASMGQLLSIGMVMVLLCSLIVLPAFLTELVSNTGHANRPE